MRCRPTIELTRRGFSSHRYRISTSERDDRERGASRVNRHHAQGSAGPSLNFRISQAVERPAAPM
jgi:hypothetical protein